MLRLLVLAVAIVAVAFMTSCAKDKSQQTCPIMGFKPDRALFSDYKGMVIDRGEQDTEALWFPYSEEKLQGAKQLLNLLK